VLGKWLRLPGYGYELWYRCEVYDNVVAVTSHKLEVIICLNQRMKGKTSDKYERD
jgi:hypothetical protein